MQGNVQRAVIKALLLRERDLWLRDWKTIPLRFILQPATQISVFASVLAGHVMTAPGAPTYASIVGPGLIVVIVINFCILNASNNIMVGYNTRLFESWLSAPIETTKLLYLLVFAAAVNGFIAGLVVMALLWLMTGTAPVSIGLGVLSVLLISVWSSLAATIAFLLPSTPDKMQNILPYFLIPISFLGCIYYTFGTLDGWPRVLALFMPTTYFSEAFRTAYAVDSQLAPVEVMLAVIVITIVALLVLLRWIGNRRLGDFTW